MRLTSLRVALFAIALLALFSPSTTAITEVGLTVSLSVSPEGSAHVNERYSMFLDTDREIEEFIQFQNFGQNTIVGWRRFVPLLRFHFAGPTSPSNTKVTARRLLNIGLRSAVIELEYDLNGSIFLQGKEGSRVTRFQLEQKYLSFDSTGNGEVLLSPLETLEFVLPTRARVDSKSSPYPTEIEGNAVRWVGPITSKWDFQYTLEQSLEDEVNAFFKELWQQAYAIVPTLLPFALVLLVAAFLFNKLYRQRK